MSNKSSIKNLLHLSIPIFFANLAIPLVAIVDTGLMGNLDDASYLTATSIASGLFSMIFWSFGFLRMGTVGMAAQAYGSSQYNEIADLVIRNITFVIIISLLLILLQRFVFNLGIQIFDLSNDTEKYFKDYFDIRIYSSFGELTIFVITGLFIGLQKTKTSSVIVGFFSFTNIIFSLFFVLYFNLNVKGVALGTLVSSTLTSFIFLIYTFFELKKLININFNIKKIFNFKKIQNIFNINFNIFIRSVLLTFSFLFFTYLGNTISEDVVAANAILINLIFLSAFILDAYAFSTEGIVGYSIGSKNIILLRDVIKNSFILSASTGLLISLLYFFVKNHFISLMTDLPNIEAISLSYSHWVVIIPFISSFCYQFDGIFVGASQTKELRNAMIFSVCIYILCAIYLINNFGNLGIWISLSIFFIARALTLFAYLERIYKKI
ncbi:MAG: DNA-damage-inducible protein F [Alphaproteobacteria bacterium MarineAlpha5_Bin9]|nr:MAG: DNA-damage-inducible protein F [Alphaproteobacteria bacterium MarineAlpha5_Bin9]|tara:strand:- start:67 stop:1377 length:1311 start_codon:yes stop_codon:yes gene_type:complete